jgi:hypothetical protein
MQASSRRVFLLQAAAGSALAGRALAQPSPSRVDAKERQAAVLGYTDDATQVDGKRFPKYAADQRCANCQVYTARAGEKTGACTVFAGKLVTADGWCSAWVPKV